MQFFKYMSALLLSSTLISAAHALTLDQAINQYANKLVMQVNAENVADARLEGDDSPFLYTLHSKNIKKRNMDGDQIPDYLVELTFCEKTNCHLTTNISKIAVFRGLKNNQVKLIDDISLGFNPHLKILPGNLIQVTDYSYGDNDPTCCPSVATKRTYKLSGEKLLRVK